jgi:hypothetical protein
VDGPKLKADAEGSPADDAHSRRFGSFAVVLIGSFLVVVNLRFWTRLGTRTGRSTADRT